MPAPPAKPDIAAGVDCSLERRRNPSEDQPALQLGAGDQGVMVGYACSETPQRMPLPVVLAHRLTSALAAARKPMVRGLRPDGKAQVTVEYGEDGKPLRLDTVVLSAQHSPNKPMDELCWELTDKVLAPALQALPPGRGYENPSEPFRAVCFGRPGSRHRPHRAKAHGGQLRHICAPRGGAFSGKDATKVDRSGAYMARYIAKNMVAAHLANRCQVTLRMPSGEKTLLWWM